MTLQLIGKYGARRNEPWFPMGSPLLVKLRPNWFSIGGPGFDFAAHRGPVHHFFKTSTSLQKDSWGVRIRVLHSATDGIS